MSFLQQCPSQTSLLLAGRGKQESAGAGRHGFSCQYCRNVWSTDKLQHLRGLTITDFRPDKHQDGSPRRGQVASQEAGIRRGQESKLRSQQNFSPH